MHVHHTDFVGPIEVKLDIDVVEILEVNDKDFSATFMMFLGASWEESRMKSNATLRNVNLKLKSNRSELNICTDPN